MIAMLISITLPYRKYVILSNITIVQMISHVYFITEFFNIFSDVLETFYGENIMYHYKILFF